MFVNWINTVKLVTLPKLIYRSNTIPSNNPPGFFLQKSMNILKLIWKCKGPRIPKTILKKKGKVRRHTS